ncbi:MAG TPA: RNA methyltransferase [Candidatus Peribacteria bacterium]|nr:RNA methyltransferase [Candidatus Peribacteria bacterium]
MGARAPIAVIAHNIRSLWNIGALFRSCDALGIDHVYLTGYSAAPPRREISKTALGAEEWIPWTYEQDPLAVIEKLRAGGYAIVGLEIAPGSVSLYDYAPKGPQCLILGHEILGVPKELQERCDTIVHIPMHGRKESLNVSVAAGIALFSLRKPAADR